MLHTHAVSHDLELQHALGATPSRLHDKVFERHVVHVLNTHAFPSNYLPVHTFAWPEPVRKAEARWRWSCGRGTLGSGINLPWSADEAQAANGEQRRNQMRRRAAQVRPHVLLGDALLAQSKRSVDVTVSGRL